MIVMGRLAFVILLVAVSVAAAARGVGPATAEIDLSQAELMLEFLDQAGRNSIDDESVARLLDAVGTQLIIAQMNLVRRVSRDQYRQVLLAVPDSEAPVLDPVDDSPRAARGVDGLTRAVWPALRWGLTHTGLLRERLEEIRSLQVSDAARRQALSQLPPGTEISAEVFVVMGGKAGAAALAGGRIYVDLLLLSFLEEVAGKPYSPTVDLTDFIAHEMHHVGLGGLLAAHRESLDLSGPEGRAYEVLSLLVSEGSATYLVSGHRDLRRALESLPGTGNGAVAGDELLDKIEALLAAILGGEIGTDEELAGSSDFLLGSGAHLVGTLMLHRIDERIGAEAVMRVMTDPRRLLVEYGKSSATAENGAGERADTQELGEELARMGEPTRSL